MLLLLNFQFFIDLCVEVRPTRIIVVMWSWALVDASGSKNILFFMESSNFNLYSVKIMI